MAQGQGRRGAPRPFNLLAVGQGGRLQAEALILAASLRRAAPGFPGRLVVAEPQPGPLWPGDPRMGEAARAMLAELGAEVVPLDSRAFGSAYPHGNKIEALALLPPGEPFLFLDTDTLVLGDLGAVPVAASAPTASMRRENTWPVEEPYLDASEVWRSLYDRFGLDFAASLDRSWPAWDWRRFLYFNAGWFCGPDPARFGETFLRMALEIRDDPPDALACQPLDPWLDQVALPLAIHALGGGRPGPELAGLDGAVTCHYRTFPLLYARESDKAVAVLEEVAGPNRLKRLLREHEPIRRLVYQGGGARARALFDRAALPRGEKAIRQRLKAEGLWLR